MKVLLPAFFVVGVALAAPAFSQHESDFEQFIRSPEGQKIAQEARERHEVRLASAYFECLYLAGVSEPPVPKELHERCGKEAADSIEREREREHSESERRRAADAAVEKVVIGVLLIISAVAAWFFAKLIVSIVRRFAETAAQQFAFAASICLVATAISLVYFPLGLFIGLFTASVAAVAYTVVKEAQSRKAIIACSIAFLALLTVYCIQYSSSSIRDTSDGPTILLFVLFAVVSVIRAGVLLFAKQSDLAYKSLTEPVKEDPLSFWKDKP